MYTGNATVVSINEISRDIYDMVLRVPEIAKEAVPGQFISVYTGDKSKLLPRPISLCDIDGEAGTLRLVYRIAGEGTREISEYSEGDSIKVMGPLGNGFFEIANKRALLFGGGIGIPPMLETAKTLCKKGVKVTTVIGYRNNDNFLADEFKSYGEVIIATDDGSVGFHGNVVDAAKKAVECKELDISDTCILACGPGPMLRGIKAFGEANSIPVQVSMEERMACGIGACLACVCKSTEKDHHSNVNNKRVCKDGPVFWAQDITL